MKQKMNRFYKMHGTGNDFIILNELMGVNNQPISNENAKKLA
jgi:diaminopimelate epimerase